MGWVGLIWRGRRGLTLGFADEADSPGEFFSCFWGFWDAGYEGEAETVLGGFFDEW
jgi:hypothetical protein